jgi:serine/threonine protein kinase
MAPDAASVFQDIALVLTPLAHGTMGSIITSKEPFERRMILFHDLLVGIKLLHDCKYVHCDIKPANVGVSQDGAVLLDMGHAQKIVSPATSLEPTPGQGGTIEFLAPEQELKQYDYSVDIWAAGIVLFALLMDYYPLQMSRNPWREGNEYLREEFHRQYAEMVLKLENAYEKGNPYCDLHAVYKQIEKG